MSTIGKIHEYFDENLDFSLFVDQREKKKKKKRIRFWLWAKQEIDSTGIVFGNGPLQAYSRTLTRTFVEFGRQTQDIWESYNMDPNHYKPT